MVDGVCLFNGVWGKIFNVCVVQSRGCFHLRIKYTYSMYQRCYTEEVSPCMHVCTSMCAAVLLSAAPKLLVLMCYCAAWWLIMTLNVYEHWSAIALKWEAFHILTGHCLTAYWWMHNNLQYDSDLHTLHINTCTRKHIFKHTQAHGHMQKLISPCSYSYTQTWEDAL